MFAFVVVASVVCCSIVLYYYCKNVLYIKYRLRGRFPSPKSSLILGNASDFLTRKKDILYVLHDYFGNYGETVLLNIAQTRLTLLSSEVKVLQFVLTSAKCIEKSKDYKNLSRWLGTGLLTGGGDKWHKNRRIMTAAFHFKILEDFVPHFEKNSKILVRKLMQHPNKSNIDIYPYVTMCTLDIICETAIGASINAQENVNSPYVKSVKTMCAIIVERAFSTYKMFDPLYFLTNDYQNELKSLKILHGLTDTVMDRKKFEPPISPSSRKGKLAFLDLLLTKMKEEHEMTEDEIKEEVNTIIFAGHDTTASAISFTLYCLLTHPEVQQGVIDELTLILGHDDFDRDVNMNDLKEMRYMEMVIKESLRLYPSVPLIGRELHQDVIYDGDQILPKGLTVLLSLYSLHRNPKYFTDPDRFDPNRFESTNESVATTFSYLPFSAGPRNCIGQKFAMNVIKTVLCRVLRTFELVPTVPAHQLELSAQTVLISTSGVRLGIKSRI